MEVINPYTGALVAEVATTPLQDIQAKITVSRQAQASWNALPFSHRRRSLEAFAHKLQDSSQACATLLSQETGKPISQALGEIQACPERVLQLLADAEALSGRQVLRSVHPQQVGEELSWDPLGVVGCISAWNYPYFVGLNVLIPALALGNAVVYKPSEYAALSGAKIAEILYSCGVPEDILVLLQGGGDVGKELITAGVDGVFFTGSHATGLAIAQQAAQSLTPVNLELGGKDPGYCSAQADVAYAAEQLASGAFYNAGQSCCAIERIYVHEAVYDAFLKAFLEHAKALKPGDPQSPETQLGPLTRRQQAQVLETQIEDAVAAGAKLRCGGKALAEHRQVLPATVLVDVDHSMALMREESFGPVIGIQKVGSDDEAVTLMNDTRYGLTASIFSQDLEHGRQLLARVQSGTAYLNCCDRVSPRLPWSGRGDSGLGATLGSAGVLQCVRPRAWHLRQSKS